jgi:predicted RNA-binding Zn ribbon-like protein
MEETETLTRPPAMFVAGHLGLDFLNSIAVPADEIVEWIADGRGFLSWLDQAGLLKTFGVSNIESHFSAKELNGVAAEARTLREWFRGFVMAHRGHSLKPASLEQLSPLINILNQDELFWSLRTHSPKDGSDEKKHMELSPLRLGLERRLEGPKALLLPVAEELAKLVSSSDFRWIRACEGTKCTLLFLDLTRRRSRRWCSMSICGNRAKQAAHRKRVDTRER